MAGSNKVTLTFAGDATQLDHTYRQVQQGGEKTATSLKHVERGTRDVVEGLDNLNRHSRASADAIDGLSSVMGANASEALILTRGIADLSDGTAVLLPKIKSMIGEMSTLKFTAGLLGGVLAGVYVGWQVGTAAGNKLNDMLGRTPSLAQQTANQIRQLTADTLGYAAALGFANAQQSALLQTKALTIAEFHAQGHTNQGDFLQGPVPLDATGHLLNSTNGGDSFAAAAAADAAAKAAVAKAQASARKLSSAAGSSAAAAIDAAAQKAKDRLSKFQQIADQFTSVAKQIAQSFSPNLEAGDPQNVVAGTGGGMSLIQKLKKQADDTIRLKKDLARLAKAGLDPGLLQNLVQGGLASLPAVEELLAGGRAEVGQANRYASQINAAGGSIAGAEAAREIRNQDKTVHVTVNVQGAQADFEKYLAKLFTTKGAKAFGLKAA